MKRLKEIAADKESSFYNLCITAIHKVAFQVPLLSENETVECLLLVCEGIKDSQNIKKVGEYISSLYDIFWHDPTERPIITEKLIEWKMIALIRTLIKKKVEIEEVGFEFLL